MVRNLVHVVSTRSIQQNMRRNPEFKIKYIKIHPRCSFNVSKLSNMSNKCFYFQLLVIKGLIMWQYVFISWEYLDVSNPAGVRQVALNHCDGFQKEQQLISIATKSRISRIIRSSSTIEQTEFTFGNSEKTKDRLKTDFNIQQDGMLPVVHMRPPRPS